MIESKLSSCVACYGLPRSISAKRSLVPGAQACRQLMTVDCVKYIMNMKHAICKGRVLLDRLGLNQCLLIGKPVLPGWVWGCFTFYELELSRLSSRWSIRSGMWEARK